MQLVVLRSVLVLLGGVMNYNVLVVPNKSKFLLETSSRHVRSKRLAMIRTSPVDIKSVGVNMLLRRISNLLSDKCNKQ